VRYWHTFNEPNLLSLLGHTVGAWPPFNQALSDATPYFNATEIMVLASAKAYDVIHAHYASTYTGAAAKVYVSQSLATTYSNERYVYETSSPQVAAFIQRLTEETYTYWWQATIKGKVYQYEPLGQYLTPVLVDFKTKYNYTIDECHPKADFMSVSYYGTFAAQCTNATNREEAILFCLLFTQSRSTQQRQRHFSGNIDQLGLSDVVEFLTRRFGMPIMVTESGIGTFSNATGRGTIADQLTAGDATDVSRQADMLNSLAALKRAYYRGVDIMGYVMWTMTDNSEWASGYSAQFGLTSVRNRTAGDLTPVPRDSYYLLRNTLAQRCIPPTPRLPRLPTPYEQPTISCPNLK
jgi:beta-glucosidase/6-phospho-beta-glucosidase/beta-galactosidase